MTLPKRSNTASPGCAGIWRRRCGRRPPDWSSRPGASARRPDAEPDIDPQLSALREEMRRHPAHRTADRDAAVRIAERYLRVERDNDQIRAKVNAATNSLARTFDRILGLLTERGFVEIDPTVPSPG